MALRRIWNGWSNVSLVPLAVRISGKAEPSG